MSYSLVLTRGQGKERALGDNVYIENLPHDCEVFIFYYPSMSGNDVLKGSLRNLGKQELGKDIFVNIGKIGDKDYKRMVIDFEIKKLPAIIITGKHTIAALKSDPSSYKPGYNDLTAYVRLDNRHYLQQVDKTLRAIGEIVNLFISGKVAEALNMSIHLQRAAILNRVKETAISVFKEVEELNIGLLDGSFHVKLKGA